MNRSISVFSLNVRGLNDPIKCGDVLSELLSPIPDIVLLQETKLSDIPPLKRHTFLPRRLDGCCINAGKPLRFESFRSVLKLLVVLKGFAIPGDLGS
jgi:hypothetical protein